MTQQPSTTGHLKAGVRGVLRHWLQDRAHYLVIALFVLCLFFTYRSTITAVESTLLFSAKKNTAAVSDTLASFRTLYTREVVQKVRGKVEVTHEAFGREGEIPLPATMTIALGEEISAGRSGVTAALYSPYPFPWREHALNAEEEPFKQAAWDYLREHPEGEYSRLDEVDGRQVFRFAVADVMRKSCVDCHNTHPESPKTDWTVGEVRGVLVVSEPIESVMNEGRRKLGKTKVSIALAGGMGLLALVMVAVTYRRRIRQQRTLQDELQLKNDELEQFAYRSSHDLKSPLTTIRGLAAYIEDDIASGEPEEALINAARIQKQAAKLEKLVVDMLDLAKADVAHEAVEVIDLEGLLDDIQADLSLHLTEKDVSLSWSIELDAPFVAQRVRLDQVLINLISNGVKYSNPSRTAREVHVKVTRTSKHYSLVVSDNGLGIPVAQKSQVFDSFTRFHPQAAEGSGLGMAIVKRHITAMGGVITFESSVDGTAFSINLPTHKEPK